VFFLVLLGFLNYRLIKYGTYFLLFIIVVAC
jgi:hypothetical protein